MSFFEKIIRGESSSEKAGEPFVREDWGDVILWRFMRVPRKVNVVFTTRYGGVSNPPYESLNLGFHVDDMPERVRRNREILASVLGIDAARITSPRQQHTAVVEILESDDQIGAGAFSEESEFDPCDGLITAVWRAPILLHYADCAPVALAGEDPQGNPVVAVLHAGRKGLIEGVVENGVRLMTRTYSVPLENMTAAVGPAIGSCCYQVGEGIASEFEAQFGSEVLSRDESGPWLDMQSAVGAALLAAGILKDSIHVLEACTGCDPEFYSYRRDGVTGRHAAVAWIE